MAHTENIDLALLNLVEKAHEANWEFHRCVERLIVDAAEKLSGEKIVINDDHIEGFKNTFDADDGISVEKHIAWEILDARFDVARSRLEAIMKRGRGSKSRNYPHDAEYQFATALLQLADSREAGVWRVESLLQRVSRREGLKVV